MKPHRRLVVEISFIVKMLLLLWMLQGSPQRLFGQDQFISDTPYTIFLVGDAGEPVILKAAIGDVIRKQIEEEANPVTILYLGDNIYPVGMPSEKIPGRELAEKILQKQVNWIKDLNVKGIFIPGNHDWQRGRHNGLKQLVNQQQWIDSLRNESIVMLPRNGCPGPIEIPLTKSAVLVIVDSQWFLHPWEKPGEESHCDAKTREEFEASLSDIFTRHHDKRVIIAAHHPLITYGDHGGVFGWKEHLFPLRELRPYYYVPLPVVGSLYPLYRRLLGHIQDTNHPIYKEYIRTMQRVLVDNPGSIYVAGHEHALQYIVKDSVHMIVSGSGSKLSYVKKKAFSRFAADVLGFAKLTINSKGTTYVEFWQVDDDFPEGKMIYADTIHMYTNIAEHENTPVDFQGKTIKVKASTQYNASLLKQRMLGKNYRSAWDQEIEVPVLDLGTELGGLSIVQKGGGMQTRSLRLADSTGREYVLRSVEKYPENAVPEMLKNTFAQDLVQDQISASHPYAALIIPTLAEAAAIYHTNPRLVYIPDDSRLGVYRKEFANSLALLEEHPSGNWSDKSYFGNSEKIINSSKVLENLQKDNDNRVDQKFVVRNRLFDLWIGDWDRHDDQWRWATIKSKDGTLYRPIPRDRDQAFFVNEGLLPKLWSRKWAMPKFEGFDTDIKWVPGLSFNARYFDRTFLNNLSLDDWIHEAVYLQQNLTDEIIEKAFGSWPDAIVDLNSKEIIEKLKARRDQLKEYAISHYRFLAKQVDITGSDKHELFVVERLSNGDVHVRITKITKEGKQVSQLYERLFKHQETKEVRLYGLGGNDRFLVSGSAKRTIMVRIIGGEGEDILNDSSYVRGIQKQTVFYDDVDNSPIQDSSSEVKDQRQADPEVNMYDRKAFQYNRLAPLLYGNFNPDDGLFFGGGIFAQTHGFRKDPFKQRHIVVASIAPLTNSYNLIYRGDFTDILGKWDVEINTDIKAPNFVNNFFGWGNESIFDKHIDERANIQVRRAIDYYRYRFEELKLEAFLSINFNSFSIKIGPAWQRIELERPDEADRYIEEYANELTYDIFEKVGNYCGTAWNMVYDTRKGDVFTLYGITWNVQGTAMKSLNAHSNDFVSLSSAISFHQALTSKGGLVLAGRLGGGMNKGTYDFFQAQILDGKTELRGFRKTRFYGDAKLYGNLEARLKLLSFRSYLFPASLGISAFHDVGRVWYEDVEGNDVSTVDGTSSRWHKGWGGGIWFTPFNLTVVSAEVGHSVEGTLFYVRLGFLF